MKKLFVADISAGDEVVDFFLVRSKNVSKTRNGNPYLDLELQDRTGVINAKMWDNVDKYESLFKRGDIIKIKAVAETYRDKLQIKINQIRLPTDKETLDPADFTPSTQKHIPSMLEELLGFIENIQNSHLKAVLQSFFDDESFRSAFSSSVAARNIHHAYVGGLLEHTLQVTKMSAYCAQIYPELDGELLIAMAILHDIGKVKELKSEADIIYTTEGFLLGHISLGLEMLNEKISAIENFPEELALKMKHILLSHHGELEFGSPIVPKMPEALALHYLDNLDAKSHIALNAIEKDRNIEEPFTEFHRVMERNFYKGTKTEE